MPFLWHHQADTASRPLAIWNEPQYWPTGYGGFRRYLNRHTTWGQYNNNRYHNKWVGLLAQTCTCLLNLLRARLSCAENKSRFLSAHECHASTNSKDRWQVYTSRPTPCKQTKTDGPLTSSNVLSRVTCCVLPATRTDNVIQDRQCDPRQTMWFKTYHAFLLHLHLKKCLE